MGMIVNELLQPVGGLRPFGAPPCLNDLLQRQTERSKQIIQQLLLMLHYFPLLAGNMLP